MSELVDPTATLLGWALAAAPVLARATGLAWTAPALGLRGLGWRIRLGLALLLTTLLTPLVSDPSSTRADLIPSAMAGSCLAELATGAGIGLVMGLVLAAARLAGEVVAAQAGLSVATLLDPGAGSVGGAEVDDPGLSPLGRLYGLVALATFLALDGPLRLVVALAESFRAIPTGGLPLSVATAEAAFARLGWALGLALRAAAPAGLALGLAGLALGLVARAASGLQVLSLSLPLRAALGVVLVLLALGTLATTFEVAWLEILQALSTEQ